MEHCAEHEGRGQCIMVAKKDAEAAHKRLDAIVVEVGKKLPTWVFTTCLSLLVVTFGGIFGLLISINTNVADISKVQTQMLAREEYRDRGKT